MKLGQLVLELETLDPETTRILDFGCGDGPVSKELASYAKQVVGVDVDQKKIQKYNESCDLHGVGKDEMYAECIDILENLPESFIGQFDVIVSSMVFHHVKDHLEALKTLKRCLKKDGLLVLTDLIKGFSVHGKMPKQVREAQGVFHPEGLDPCTIMQQLQHAGFQGLGERHLGKQVIWVPLEVGKYSDVVVCEKTNDGVEGNEVEIALGAYWGRSL